MAVPITIHTGPPLRARILTDFEGSSDAVVVCSYDLDLTRPQLDQMREALSLLAGDAEALGPDDKGHTDRCVECGSTRVSYENYLDQLFCWPCADGQDWPRHPRKRRAPESEVHVHPGGIDPDLLNPVKAAKR